MSGVISSPIGAMLPLALILGLVLRVCWLIGADEHLVKAALAAYVVSGGGKVEGTLADQLWTDIPDPLRESHHPVTRLPQ